MREVNEMADNWLSKFGFWKSPYSTKPLSAEEGDKLLVGREKEVRILTQRLTASSRIPILVGDNGVGKTSIANVVAFRLSKEYKTGDQRYFVLDLNRIRNTHLSDPEVFERYLYYEIIFLLLHQKEFLKQRGISDQEFNEVYYLTHKMVSNEDQVAIGVIGVEGGQPNPFKESYLFKMIREWLSKCFCKPYSGGIICVIDNLENNGTSRQVQNILETLRDTVFAIPGLLWILCGTPISVNSSLASKRLEGYLECQEIYAIDECIVPELIARRIEYFSKENADPPVNQKLFEFIYSVVNSQLRVALSLCEEFADYLFTYPKHQSKDNRALEFKAWLKEKATELPDREYEIPSISWRLFEAITDLGTDVFSIQYAILGFENEEQLYNAAFPLITKRLIEEVKMEPGYVLRATQEGWLVNYKRSNK